jgi:Protein of unknown function (DUF1638)
MDRPPVVVIACRVLQDLLARLLPAGLATEVVYTDHGLHRQPGILNKTVQEAIDCIKTPSLVVLGYGLCGDGLAGVRSGRHTLLIPRADDCVTLFLGSHDAYRREFRAVPATFYLTKGWLESDCNPAREYQEYVDKYGPDNAAFIVDMQYQHLKRLALVAHSQADLVAYRPRALEVAHYCERWSMRYEEILGSDAYIRRLVEAAADLESAGDDFVVIPPGGELRQAHFLCFEQGGVG